MLLNGLWSHFAFAPDGGSGGDPPKEGEGAEEGQEGKEGGVEETLPEDSKEFDSERARAFIKSLRKSEKKLKDTLATTATRLAGFEEADRKAHEGEKSNLQKAVEERDAAQAKASKLEEDLQDTRIRNAISTEAARMGFRDPEDGYNLGDLSEVAYDATTGQVKGAKAMLTALLKDKGYLVDPELAKRLEASGKDGHKGPGTPPKPGGGNSGAGAGRKEEEKQPEPTFRSL